jgi:TPR repeat protein
MGLGRPMPFWSWWETLDDAERELEGPRPVKGLRILRRLATHGNVEAQFRLGLTFEYGQSGETEKIESNIREAARWYKQAADNGHQRASDQLWQVFLHEGHVDEEKALTYLLIAAKKGVANAQRFLGICYMNGDILPVPKDYAEGLTWLRKSAKAGSQCGQTELAKAYRDGMGVEANLVKAYVWFSMAARQELADNQKQMDREKNGTPKTPASLCLFHSRRARRRSRAKNLLNSLRNPN